METNDLILKGAKFHGTNIYADQFGNIYSFKETFLKRNIGEQKRRYLNSHFNGINFELHTIIAICWHGPRPEGLVIDHINRNKHDNRPENLRYVTHSENNRNIAKPWILWEKRNGKWRKRWVAFHEIEEIIGKQMRGTLYKPSSTCPCAIVDGVEYVWVRPK